MRRRRDTDLDDHHHVCSILCFQPNAVVTTHTRAKVSPGRSTDAEAELTLSITNAGAHAQTGGKRHNQQPCGRMFFFAALAMSVDVRSPTAVFGVVSQHVISFSAPHVREQDTFDCPFASKQMCDFHMAADPLQGTRKPCPSRPLRLR
jgi:hypothetical protein